MEDTKKYIRAQKRLMRAERKVNEEAEMEMKQYWKEQGLSREFPYGFIEGSFFYDHMATTEQRAALDDAVMVRSEGLASVGFLEIKSIPYRLMDSIITEI